MDDLEKQWGTSSTLHQAFCIISKPSMNSNWSYNLEMHNWGQNWFFCHAWAWNLTDDLENLPDTSILCQASSNISKPSVNWNWSYSPETLNSGQNRRFCWPRDLKIWRMALKNNRAPFLYCSTPFYTSRAAHHFKAIGQFKMDLQSGNAQFGSKSATFCSVWPWDLMDGLEKQKGTSSVLRQALCIISQPSVNSNWIYSLETPNLGQNRRFLAVWPWNSAHDLTK